MTTNIEDVFPDFDLTHSLLISGTAPWEMLRDLVEIFEPLGGKLDQLSLRINDCQVVISCQLGGVSVGIVEAAVRKLRLSGRTCSARIEHMILKKRRR